MVFIRRCLRVLPAILLILGVFTSLAAVSPVLAAAPPYPCPSTESQLSDDITAAGAGGTVKLACPTSTTIYFDLADGGSGAPITISQSVTLDASRSPGAITVDGGNSTGLFSVSSGQSFDLISLTLVHGNSATSGGAIYNYGGTVTITASTFSDNSASSNGGAIDNNSSGTVTIAASTFAGNSASYGGAINNSSGAVTVTASTFSGNSAVLGAGAINNFSGAVTVTTSTFSGNSATSGGAIDNDHGGTVTVTASTFAGNSASYGGGTIDNFSGTVTVTTSTFAGNSATNGGAIDNTGTATIGGDIIANSPTGRNCFINGGTITDEGYNLDDDGSCTSGQTGDITGEDPLLAPLGNYGGPTQTMALLPGSPAIDQIPVGYSFTVNTTTYNLCPSSADTDQRGYPRPDSNDGMTETVCDIGAYEYQDTAYTISGSHTAYDIESSNWYCTNGSTSCIPPTDTVASDCLTMTPCPGASYGAVEAFGPPTNTAYGTPDELILACIQGTQAGYQIGYLDVVSQQGSLDYPSGTRPGPGVYGMAESGTISAKGTLIGGGGSEDNPSQPSSVSGSAFDLSTGIIGSVTGIQNTDNGTDTLNSGQFRVTIRGKLWTVNTTGAMPVTTRNTTSSSISCTVGGQYGTDLMTAGIDTDALAEGELENALGDNQFLQTFAPHSMPT